MKAAIDVRTARHDDLDTLSDIFLRASLSNEGDRELILAHPEIQTYDDVHVRAGHTRVAVLDGCVVGFATLLPGDDFELEDLFVTPEWMRHGVARSLIDDLVAIARRLGAARIDVTANDHALAFYEAVGFVADGRVATPLGGDATRMHLAIA
ncbi:MAG: GNAT family N-acetyltransferase [Acidimicrobiia bacterium]